jgi:Na+-transporting methylmalonyl-CoA/oxaloacetate decarboxylase gamma subunit
MEFEEKLVVGVFLYVLMIIFIVRFISTNERDSFEREFDLANDWEKQKKKEIDGGIYEF